jgi:hypothetical protein
MERIQELMKKHPSYMLLSKSKLFSILRLKDPSIRIKDVEDFLSDKPLQQVFRRAKKHKPLLITGPPNSFQIDIIHLPNYKRYNKGISRFLLFVDILSRKAFAYPLKTGTIADVIRKCDEFMKEVKDINSITGDDFFSAKPFTEYTQSKGIDLYTDVAAEDHIVKSSNKLGVIDRLTRTLKSIINRRMVSDNDVKWTTWLHEVIELYNDLPHRTLNNFTPNEVWSDEYIQLQRQAHDEKENIKNYEIIPKFKIGDLVRVYKGKKQFQKEGETFSRDVYKVVGIDKNKYIVNDEDGNWLKRRFKPSEMITTKAPKPKTGDKVDKAVRESVVGRNNKRAGVDEDNIITKKRKPNLRITITGKRQVEWKEEDREERGVHRKVYVTRKRAAEDAISSKRKK